MRAPCRSRASFACATRLRACCETRRTCRPESLFHSALPIASQLRAPATQKDVLNKCAASLQRRANAVPLCIRRPYSQTPGTRFNWSARRRPKLVCCGAGRSGPEASESLPSSCVRACPAPSDDKPDIFLLRELLESIFNHTNKSMVPIRTQSSVCQLRPHMTCTESEVNV